MFLKDSTWPQLILLDIGIQQTIKAGMRLALKDAYKSAKPIGLG